MDVDLCTVDYFYCVNFDILLFFFLYRLMKKQKLLTCFFKSKSLNAQHEDSNNSTSYKRLHDQKMQMTKNSRHSNSLQKTHQTNGYQFHQPQIFHFIQLRHLNSQNQSAESKIYHVNPLL